MFYLKGICRGLNAVFLPLVMNPFGPLNYHDISMTRSIFMKGSLAGYWLYCPFLKVSPSVIPLLNDSSVSSRHSHLPNFWILLIREYRRTEIWAIQPVSSRGAFPPSPIEVECGFSVVSGYLQCSTEHGLLGIFSAALKIHCS